MGNTMKQIKKKIHQRHNQMKILLKVRIQQENSQKPVFYALTS